MFMVDHSSDRRRLQVTESELGGDMAVATAFTYYQISRNFRYTNGERPFYAHELPNGTIIKRFDRDFMEGYAGELAIAFPHLPSPSSQADGDVATGLGFQPTDWKCPGRRRVHR